LGEQTALLANDLAANGPRQHYMLARLEESTEGAPRVAALASQDSARISGLVAADALLVRPADAAAAHTDDPVRILPLDL
jgi:molybdopterin molybdotransferase